MVLCGCYLQGKSSHSVSHVIVKPFAGNLFLFLMKDIGYRSVTPLDDARVNQTVL